MRNISQAIFAIGLFIGGLVTGNVQAASIAITPSSNSSYLVTGSDLTAVASLEIAIDYDTATLTNPRPAAGPLSKGAMFVANPNTPGRIFIALATLSPISGNGALATITFDNSGSSAGRIVAMSIYATDSKGTQLPVSSMIGSQPDSPAAEASLQPSPQSPLSAPGTFAGATPPPAASTPAQPSTPGAKSPVSLGSVTASAGSDVSKGNIEKAPAASGLPSEPLQQAQPAAERQEPRSQPDEAASSVTKPASEELSWQPPVVQGILQLFRDFQGERTPKNLLALFTENRPAAVRQEPAVVLSDGKNQVTVYVDLPSDRQAPNFALKAAKLVALKQAGERTWAVTVCPDKNVTEANISVMYAGRALVISVTVAPPIAGMLVKKEQLNEAAFVQFLKERGSDSAPLGDLNNDGRHDYVDDFIYASNYLALKASVGKNSER